MTFDEILSKYRSDSESKFEQGTKFEQLMKRFLQVYPMYRGKFSDIWLWNEFPYRDEISGKDIGIDLVTRTVEGEFWAIQCKFYEENTEIDKPAVDSFITTSGSTFKVDGIEKNFALRLWIDTTIKGFSRNARAAIKNQNPPLIRLGRNDLQNADVDWKEIYESTELNETIKTRELRDFQQEAVGAVHKHFKKHERGRLIMACGSGKTFTALKIAENEVGEHGLVLFLVPSISLLAQTFSEWNAYSKKPIDAICVCSDETVKTQFKRSRNFDNDEIVDVEIPVEVTKSTEEAIKKIYSARQRVKNGENHYGMTVIYSTYQSLNVINEVQSHLNFEFDLIICDEAHRTAGYIKDAKTSEFDPLFTRVHDGNFVKSKHRLYMTATPRMFKVIENSKKLSYSTDKDISIWSMDDESIFGEEIYKYSFARAIRDKVLADYKIMLFTTSDYQIPINLKQMINDKNQSITVEDAANLIGCMKALSKIVSRESKYMVIDDPEPMKRAIAFCSRINDSKDLVKLFKNYQNDYSETFTEEEKEMLVKINADHIDGTMSASERRQKLKNLENVPENGETKICNILSNARCLSEGIDVPTLDAVIFMSTRRSIIDVVQAVGRVMRKPRGSDKQYGYIIIPIFTPFMTSPESEFSNNKKYEVIYDVLNALRSHDERLDWLINKIKLNQSAGDKIIIDNGGNFGINEKEIEIPVEQIPLNFKEVKNAVFVKIVDKLASSYYWQTWGNDVAKIADRHKKRIKDLISVEGEHQLAFNEFLESLHKNINPEVTEDEAIDMLSQHLITKPVFESLFENYSFMQKNVVSQSMEKILSLMDEDGINKELNSLKSFYDSVKGRCANIKNFEDRQRIIIDLYDKFFRVALPKAVEQLGIVYTPVEVVDFILNSVNDVLKSEFNQSLSDENIHILDPFSGTGTFLTRLIQSNFIKDEDLEYKYKNELHANEIILLAYYISCINIENAYHERTGSENYEPFEKMCLTDTFQIYENNQGKIFNDYLIDNANNIENQKRTQIQVIIGNPPYSVGQRSANDNAQNKKYEILHKKIELTYAKKTNATNKNSLYDSYIKAFRWASDRIIDNGVIGFVTNAGWLDGAAMDGLRKCFEEEFTSIYVFNLRGNQRTQGELSRKEGGKIFGSGSRAPIAITILVKNGNRVTKNAQIYYKEVEDYLTREQKLTKIAQTKSILDKTFSPKIIKPNAKHDWINKREENFDKMIIIGDKKDKLLTEKVFCDIYSRGLETGRDAWCYNFSIEALQNNIKHTIKFYNDTLNNDSNQQIYASTKISWTETLKKYHQRKIKIDFNDTKIIESYYRPFTKSNVYYDEYLNHRKGQMAQLFPNGNDENLLICVPGIGNTKEFSALIVDKIPDLGFNSACQCFPLYWYEEPREITLNLEETEKNKLIRHDGITDYIFKRANMIYGGNVTKEDIFYYVYGFLHLPAYREQFANELKKSLPRLILVPETEKFWQLSKAGRALAEIHLNYENQEPPKDIIVEISKEDYKVTDKKMRLSADKTTLQYNQFIKIKNIPPRANKYIVNGRSPLEWIIDRYYIKIDKDSKIENNPNLWCEEHGDPKYIFNLILSCLTVSLKTLDIVDSLPKVEFDD